MKIDHLKLPENYIINGECNELLKFHLCEFMCTKEKIKEHQELGVVVCLSYNCPIKIKYNNKKWYWVALVKDKENGHFYWYMRPYKKSYFTTRSEETYTTSFDMVVQAVLDDNKE